MHTILQALAPHLLELIAAILTLIIGALAAKARERWGIEIEARHREALHSALMTGMRHALASGIEGRDSLAEATVAYARASVPNALEALRPSAAHLLDMAEAALERRERE
jgi:hypothetical protein